ncbi:MAG: sialidase family protein [Abditibacteriaceae bacterium]
MPCGRWICSLRAAPEKTSLSGQHILLCHSDDEGRSWTQTAPFTVKELNGKTGTFRTAFLTALGGEKLIAILCWVDQSQPELPFFNEVTEGLLDTRVFLSRSFDCGQTWSEPEHISTLTFDVPTPITGPILVVDDTTWACQFELNKHYSDTSEWRHSSVLIFSQDEGRSWPEYSIAANDSENRVFYWDQRPAVLADGMLLVAFWTYDNQEASYRNIHLRESIDGGHTWSDLWDSGIPGQPAPPCLLSDGRIVLVYVDRTATPCIKMRSSSDCGRTWPIETEVIIHESKYSLHHCERNSMQDAWSEMSAFAIGLPATASLPNGDLLVVFYGGSDTDHTDIHWTRVGL